MTKRYEINDIELYSSSKPTDQVYSEPDYVDVTSQHQQQPPSTDYDIPYQQQQPTPNEKPHQQPQQIVPHQEPVKKTQIAITIVMLLLILLALGVLLILVTAVLVTGNTCTCGDTTANSGGSGVDEVNQRILQIVKDISRNVDIYHHNSTQLQYDIQNTTVRVSNEELKAIKLLSYNTSTLVTKALNVGLQTNEEALQNSTQLLTDNIFSTSSHLENTTAKFLANVIPELGEILDVLNKLLFSLQPISCKIIKSRQPNSPTGYYNVSHPIFCNMGELCGSEGGWTRLAYLNMTDDTENCPSGFRLYEGGGVRACGRLTSGSGGCSSVMFPSNGINYSEICGRVVGYQYYTTDAVYNHNNYNINGAYVDGVSITRGSPRQHVWTLMAGWSESGSSQPEFDCPCNNGSSQPIPSFIGSHYYCESGNPSPNPFGFLYQSDPLWDGEGCDGIESPCCSSQDLPWFHRDYGNTTTTDYIELRVCSDEPTDNEDVPVGLYEIYVK